MLGFLLISRQKALTSIRVCEVYSQQTSELANIWHFIAALYLTMLCTQDACRLEEESICHIPVTSVMKTIIAKT